MQKTTISVEGMSCAHCENAVQTEISNLDGIKKVKASSKKNTVVVKFDEALVNLEQINKAIEEAGFRAINN
ncbi:copper-binding protein [Clostridia bacterium]|nr:copper-binding protein [Clostridia bacterium]